MRTEKVLRKSKVIPFLTSLEIDRKSNFNSLIAKVKLLRIDGLEQIHRDRDAEDQTSVGDDAWDKEIWKITGGRLLEQSGRNSSSVTINFSYPPKLGGQCIDGDWGQLAKTLFLLRLHSKQQNLSNQRGFIIAVGYVAYFVNQRKASIYDITREDLDLACAEISKDYKESSAYNLHKLVAEFAGYLDANGLCKNILNYKYSKQKRPDSANSVGTKRLDDPETLETTERVLAPVVFKVLGQLYQNVQKDHKYRFYILLLTFFACTGRRFSELSLLPFQEIQIDKDGGSYLEYFPRKVSKGNTFTPKRKLYLPSQTLPLVKDVISEIQSLTKNCRETAFEMHRSQTVDLRFLENCPERIYKQDLKKLSINPNILLSNSRLSEEGFVFPDHEKLTVQGKKPNFPIRYTTVEGLKQYCSHHFNPRSLAPIHTDQFGKKYFLHDLMFIRYYTIDFLHKSFFNQFNCLSFTQSKLYMPASKLNRRFNLLRRFLYTQDKILKHFILPNTCST